MTNFRSHWFQSPHSAERTAYALQALSEAGRFVVLAPRRAVADELVWRAVEAGQSASGIDRTTPTLLAAELASDALAREGRANVGPTAVRAVLAQVVDKALSTGKLTWFSSVAELPGFLPSLQATLEELRFAGVGAEQLECAVVDCGGAPLGNEDQAQDRERSNSTSLRAHLRLLQGGLHGIGVDRRDTARPPGAREEGREAAVEERERRVFAELAVLAEGYEEELRRFGLADRAWVFARAIEVVSGNHMGERFARWLAPWKERPQLWFDVALHSVLEREFFAELTALSGHAVAVVPERDLQTVAALREILGVGPAETPHSTASVQAADSEDKTPPVEDGASATRLSRVQETLFASTVEVRPPLEDHSFDFFSAAGEGQEAVEIARRIGSLAQSGVRFDEIAVLVRQPSTYLPLIEDAFARANIPAFFARGSSRPDPGGRAFLALLACADEGFSATRFLEFLSFDQLPPLARPVESQDRKGADAGLTGGTGDSSEFTDAIESSVEVPWVAPSGEQLVLKSLIDAGEVDENAEVFSRAERVETTEIFPSSETPSHEGGSDDLNGLPTRRVPPAAWERLIVDAAVVGGADRWRRRLDGLRTELERRAAELGPEEEARAAGIRWQRERLEDLASTALPIIQRLEAFPEGESWAHWIEALQELAVATLRWPRSVLSILAELRPMAAVDDVSLADVQRVLEQPLRDMEAEPPSRRHGRVFVGGIELARGRSFEAVFVPGLAEGVFPARAVEDPLLLDSLRDQLAESVNSQGSAETGPLAEVGAEDGDPQLTRGLLSTQANRFHRERLLLRLAVGAAKDRLIVSYPRVDVMLGRARVPSFYALDLLRAAEGRLPELKGLEQRAAAEGGAGASWPAPERPEDAIDDAEFDLSLLHPFQDETGAARFLLFANPHLSRSLNARARRWRRPFTWADGLVVDPSDPNPITTQYLASQRPTSRSYSPTALQHFSVCPYRFLLQAIHRLRPSEDRTGFEQLDPLTRGSLFHDVQFFLFQRLRDQGLLPVRSENLNEVLDLADTVLDETAAQTYEDMAPAIDRIWNSEVESLRNDLRGWLRQVSENPQWTPVAAELAFGLPKAADRDPGSVEAPVEVEGFKLRGSIDLVELAEKSGRIRVTDHKTGRAHQKADLEIDGGKVLQPVLYAVVAERLLNGPLGQIVDRERDLAEADGPEADGATEARAQAPNSGSAAPSDLSRIPEAFKETSGLSEDTDDSDIARTGALRVDSGRLYYCTVRGGYRDIEVPLGAGARQSGLKVLETVDDHVSRGFLPAAPDDGACRYCDYSLICGPYEERRIRRKRQADLEELKRLRRLK